jgi:hypothetical protein
MTPWGVGSYEGPDGARVPWEISHEEIQRDVAAAAARLGSLGIGPGDRVLVCSMLAEAGQFWPLIVGTYLAGAQVSCADANRSDAARVAMFTRHLGFRAVLGVSAATLDGLDALGLAYGEVFGAVPVVGARPGAHGRLRATGLAPHLLVVCGPAVALADGPDAPARVDAAEWELSTVAGRVAVSNRRPRMTTFDRTPTAVCGEVVGDGLLPREEGP